MISLLLPCFLLFYIAKQNSSLSTFNVYNKRCAKFQKKSLLLGFVYPPYIFSSLSSGVSGASVHAFRLHWKENTAGGRRRKRCVPSGTFSKSIHAARPLLSSGERESRGSY